MLRKDNIKFILALVVIINIIKLKRDIIISTFIFNIIVFFSINITSSKNYKTNFNIEISIVVSIIIIFSLILMVLIDFIK